MNALISPLTRHDDDVDYQTLEKLVAERVAAVDGPLLVTDATGMFDEFLSGIPAERRQNYRCNCCWRFIERFGALVTVDDDGDTESVLWGPEGVPEFFRKSVQLVRERVLEGRVCGVLVNDQKVWGDQKTGNFTHLHGAPKFVFASPIKTGSQAAAEKVEEFGMITRVLAEFKRDTVEQAVRVLEAGAVGRSEKAAGAARWLLALHDLIGRKAGERKSNLVWRAAATAPPGFAHARSNLLGTLLEDLRAGTPFDEVQRKWASKVDPTTYMRPTTVTAGNVTRAEKIVEQMESSGALARRFAKLTDVHDLWMPREEKQEPAGGVFGGVLKDLKPAKKAPKVDLPPENVTWEKFSRVALEGAQKMEVLVPHHSRHFYGLTVGANPDAPPLLQWDTEPRNSASAYIVPGGSGAQRWNLVGGQWCDVTAVFENPPHWYEPEKFAHHTKCVLFALKGCRDTQIVTGGGFFPETLRSEYHEIRSTMEAYAKRAAVAGRDEGDANGIAVGLGEPVTVRVTSALGTATYIIDRLD